MVLMTILAIVVLLAHCACPSHAMAQASAEQRCCDAPVPPAHSEEVPGCRHCDNSVSPVPEPITPPVLEVVCLSRVDAAVVTGQFQAFPSSFFARPPDPVGLQARLCVLLN